MYKDKERKERRKVRKKFKKEDNLQNCRFKICKLRKHCHEQARQTCHRIVCRFRQE